MLLFLFLLQLAVWYGLYRRVLRIPDPAPTAQGDLPPLSVLIAARNEAENLKRFLPAVLNQDYPVFEVLVIDDAGTDHSETVLNELAGLHRHLRVIRMAGKQRAGKKDALRRGIGEARYERLVFTDADCMPASRQWLRRLGDAWGPETDIVLGYAPFFAENTFFNRWVRFEADMAAVTYLSLAAVGMPYMGVGRNMGWKRSLFEKTNGFSRHEHLPGGDDDLLVNAAANRQNTALVLHPDAFVFSPAKPGLSPWLRQKRRHLSAGLYYKPGHQVVLFALSFSRALFHLWCAVLLCTTQWPWAAAALLGRWLLVWPLYGRIKRRFRSPPYPMWLSITAFPVFDLLLSVYDAFVVPRGLWRRSADW